MTDAAPADTAPADTVPAAELFGRHDGVPLPTPASVDLRGALPIRAAQFCVPITAASGLGRFVTARAPRHLPETRGTHADVPAGA